MPTTGAPGNIWYPDANSPVAPLENLFLQLADSVNVAIAAIDTKLADTGWVNLATSNGWSGVGSDVPQIRKIGKIVYLTGIVENGTAQTVLFIPSGSRTSRTMRLSVLDFATGNNVYISLFTDGAIQVSSSSPTTRKPSFSGISYVSA